MKFFKIFLISYFLYIGSALFTINNDIIEKIKKIENISFNFIQKIADKTEFGKCTIKYSKLMICDYDDTYKKRIIANGKKLAIIQRRYKKITYYPIKKTPVNLILDKEFIVDIIAITEPNKIDNLNIEFKIAIDEKKYIIIIFDKNTFYLKGWRTSDIYNDDVNFHIKDLEINTNINKNIFIIPNEEDL